MVEEDVTQGSLVHEYVGEIIDELEVQNRLQNYQASGITDYYMVGVIWSYCLTILLVVLVFQCRHIVIFFILVYRVMSILHNLGLCLHRCSITIKNFKSKE